MLSKGTKKEGSQIKELQLLANSKNDLTEKDYKSEDFDYKVI